MGAYHNVLTLLLAAASANNICQSQTPGAAGAMTINGSASSSGVATLDVARRVLITPSANESSKTFVVTGTDRKDRVQSETLQGTNATAFYTTKDFKTVTSVTISAAAAGAITVGTNGVASTEPKVVDRFINPANYSLLREFAAGNTSILEVCYEDLAPYWDLTTNNPTWVTLSDVVDPGVAHGPFTMIRLTTTSGTGLSKATILTPFNGGRV